MKSERPCPCCGQIAFVMPFWLDEDGHRLHADGISYKLTEKQSMIMEQLVRRFPQVARRALLFDALWGDDPNGGPDADKSIEIQIHKIRKKMIGSRIGIETVPRSGYRLVVKEADDG